MTKVKKYINEYLYPVKNNVDDCDSISDILCELEINEDDYYTDVGISKDNNYELHLVRRPNSCLSTTILKVVC